MPVVTAVKITRHQWNNFRTLLYNDLLKLYQKTDIMKDTV